jgi:hypothetical protein
MMPASSIEPSVVANVEVARVVPDGIATVRCTLVTMTMLVRAIRAFRQIETGVISCSFLPRAHRSN